MHGRRGHEAVRTHYPCVELLSVRRGSRGSDCSPSPLVTPLGGQIDVVEHPANEGGGGGIGHLGGDRGGVCYITLIKNISIFV